MAETAVTEPRGTLMMHRRCPDCGHLYGPDGVFCPFDGQKLVPSGAALPADPLIGTTVDGRYLINAVLGEGGMGTVYDVRHVALNRAFAMKALRRDLAAEADLGERFIREARATAAVIHPGVVSITDFGHLADARPYFVMEKLEGRTLASVLSAGGAMPAARGAMLLVKVARALHAAHGAGIVHRDLKPENIFLLGRADAGPEQQVRVVDFGAAQIAGKSRLTRAGIVFGTPYYMSPEQAAGAVVDPRSDIFALGVIMYELYSGKVPFEGDTYMGVLTQHLYATPKAPSSLLPQLEGALGALEDITLKCLEKQPQNRFASMAEVAAAIESVLTFDEHGAAKVSSRGIRAGQPAAASMADALELPSHAEIALRTAAAHARADRSALAMRLRLALPVVLAAVLIAGVLIARRGSPRAPAAIASGPTVAAPALPTPVALPASASSAVGTPSARSVRIESNVPAEVWLGDVRVGRTPLDLKALEGERPATYTARADGYLDQDVSVGSASPDRLVVGMRRRAGGRASPASSVAPATLAPSAAASSPAPATHALPTEISDPWK